MEFYNICLLFFILLSSTFLFVTFAEEECPESDRNKKCTSEENLNKIHHYCMMYSKDWSLWCRRSIVINIPKPNTMPPFKSCGNATAILIDDSCLRDITQAEVESYPNITRFLCGKNFIKKLPGNLFAKNKKLKEVNFCRNDIEEIHKDTFAGLSSLEILCLANNKLSDIPPYSFENLGSLRELSLHGNEITKLKAGVFHGLKNLQILKLTANKIGTIEEKAFWSLPSLTHLHLDQNKLKIVNVSVFKKLLNLEVLTISYNTMEKWGEVGENALGKVHTLNLASNLLSTFHSSHVRNMSKLQNLSLENNLLASLADNVFSGTAELRYIDVSENFLESIGKHTFSHLCHLETLVLRKNKLKTPHAEWFTHIVKNGMSEGNDISENEWNCNCEAIGHQKFLQDLKTKEETRPWSDVLRITCKSPKNLTGQLLDEETAKTILATDCGVKNVTQKTPCPPQTTDFERIPSTYKYSPTPKKKPITETTTAPIQTTSTPENVAKFDTNTQEKQKYGTWLLVLGVVAIMLLVIVTLYMIVRRKTLKKHSAGDSESSLEKERAEMLDFRHDEGAYNHLNFDQTTYSSDNRIHHQYHRNIRETSPKSLLSVERAEEEDDGYTPMKSMEM